MALVALGAGCGLAWLLPACESSQRADRDPVLRAGGPPALHAVHSDRLNTLMDELSDLTLERLPQELDAEAEQRRRMGEVEELAAKLAETAEHIPEAAAAVQLAEADRDLFVRLADRLCSESSELRQHAADGDVDRAQETLHWMTATCNACHSLFREVPPLD